MNLLAVLSVGLAGGTWFGIRWSETGRQLDDMIATILSTPLQDWQSTDIDPRRCN